MTSRGQVPLRAETNEDGAFGFEEAAEGEWALIVSARGYFNFQDDIVVEADQALELEIALQSVREEVETGSVSGVVSNQNDEPIAEARIIMTSRGQIPLRTETNEDGAFDFAEVAVGDWSIIAGARGYFNFQDDVVIEADEAVELEIVLESIRGDEEEVEPDGVWGNVLCYWPQQDYLSLPVNTLIEFEVFPFDPEDDLLDFLWILNDEPIGDASWVSVNFESIGMYEVTVQISDTEETVSLTWEISINPNIIITEDVTLLPDKPILTRVTPNPFNAVATVDYYLPAASFVRLSILNTAGQHIQTLSNGWQMAGEHQIVFNGRSHPAGTYILRLETGNQIHTKRLLLLK